EVFRAGVGVQHAAAETDRTTAAVVDREHHPVAELVVDAAAVVLGEQAAALEQAELALVGAERVAQRVETIRRVADAEACADVGIHAAIIQIGLRLRTAEQLFLE